jgi:hypothetical protein
MAEVQASQHPGGPPFDQADTLHYRQQRPESVRLALGERLLDAARQCNGPAHVPSCQWFLLSAVALHAGGATNTPTRDTFINPHEADLATRKLRPTSGFDGSATCALIPSGRRKGGRRQSQ